MNTILTFIYLLLMLLTCCSTVESVQFEKGVQFPPSDAHTTMIMNYTISLTTFSITNESVYFDGFPLQLMTHGGETTAWLNRWQPPTIDFDIITTGTHIDVKLGRFKAGKNYRLYIDGFYQNMLCEDGNLMFSASPSSIYTTGQWDLNLDGIVNYLEVSAICSHYGFRGEWGWIKEDINDDGVVNYCEISSIVSNYLH